MQPLMMREVIAIVTGFLNPHLVFVFIVLLPVFPTRPSLDGRARLDGRLGKIARLTPVFL